MGTPPIAAVGFATDCKPPTFDIPSVLWPKLIAEVDGDILVVAADRTYDTKNMTKLRANGPAEVLDTTFPADFPADGYITVNWGPKRMLALAGYNESTVDMDTVFKYENGSWTKMGWTLGRIQWGGLACTDNDKLAIVGGRITDPRNPSGRGSKIHDM